MVDRSALEKRIAELLALSEKGPISEDGVRELISGTISVLSAVHGADSVQLRVFVDATTVGKMTMGRGGYFPTSQAVALGTLRTLREDLSSGLTRSLRGQITGEVVGDFVTLAREVLSDTSDGAKNVASVLAAAAFEDTLRRLAAMKGAVHREKLADIVTDLKDREILIGAQVGIAGAYLKFRNNALHARWESVDRSSVTSALAFVEQLLLKHFS